MMSILAPLSSSGLTRERLAEILASGVMRNASLHLLRWLTWFPLLSTEELVRLEQARLAKQERMRSPQRVALCLRELETFQLLAHVVINEPGWPLRQHRYYLTDMGLYAFAAFNKPPLSVPHLAQAYPVERADLLARLARIDLHLPLAAFFARLVGEGDAQGYQVTSFQHPWQQTETILGRRQTVHCDAAFLLRDSQGAEYAFYVRIDANERRPFDPRRERVLLVRLLNLRDGLHLHREAMPRLLILSGASHLTEWARLLEKTSAQRGTALLDGGLTTLQRLQRSGVYAPIWWTFAEFVQGMGKGSDRVLAAPSTRLVDLLEQPASPLLAERFSQRRTFAHLLTERQRSSSRTTSRPLPSYVGKLLPDEGAPLRPSVLTDALRGTKTEQQEATAYLTIALSATQKELLFWLTHHPLLTVHHLAALHAPAGHDVRSVQRQVAGLARLNLLHVISWYKARLWRERERYVLSEAALRYSALREGRQATYYLLAEPQKKKYTVEAFAIQQGTAGLFGQMEHTHGLYDYISRFIAVAYRERVQLLTWKSARECIRTYLDPFTHVPMQVRPDAELTYQVEGQALPHRILLEYDRATTTERDLIAKYQSYADYLVYSGDTLPPLLVVTQDEQAVALIRHCLDRIGLHVPVLITLQDQLGQGFLMILAACDRS
jgi:hypothetical protein